MGGKDFMCIKGNLENVFRNIKTNCNEFESAIIFYQYPHKVHMQGGAHRAISVKTVHQLHANDCQNCGLWVY